MTPQITLPEPCRSTPLGRFAGRLLIMLVFAVLAAALWQLTDILVLLFGAVLLSIGLCAATRLVSSHTGMGRGVALWVANYPYGRQLLDQMRGQTGGPGSGTLSGANVLGAAGWATSMVTVAAGVITHALGYALFVAIYLRRSQTATVLQRWLVGQMVVMLIIGILTSLGLWAMGIEAAAALGLIGGLLCFITFVGAIVAAIPATLVALTQGPVYAAAVVLMYTGVHFVEGNFITPMVQAEATSFPPVLAILSTVAFNLLLGPIGVLLAAPLTLFLMAAVEVLYVQQALGEAPLGERQPLPVASAVSVDEHAVQAVL